MQAAIKVDSIHFAYGSQKAVNGISFEVAPGEVLGFLGPNGAGKSTTIKMLTGQLIPAQGQIHILGQAVRGHSSAVHQRMGVSFEEKNLYLQMSAVENLKFYANLFGIKKPDIDGLLEQVDLLKRKKDRVSSFSKGMRQRLMIARALINDPEVLFLDEPTDGLDPVSAQAIRNIIRARSASGTAVLLTTHDMTEADKLSDRVAFINEGVLHAVDTPENLKLKHGQRSALVRVRQNGGIEEIRVALDSGDTGEALKQAVQGREVLTVHTEEASLEDIFIKMTGRGL
ncbi:MAG: ABC transporter ATP-binding protein [Spirochaetes bacterium]|nr:ABC transporter ATP-binding protein [Spirochaetota bacterium]MBU0956213.1 ABC transporter ATP-binding protein [Spirochaetota bacterium]